MQTIITPSTPGKVSTRPLHLRRLDQLERFGVFLGLQSFGFGNPRIAFAFIWSTLPLMFTPLIFMWLSTFLHVAIHPAVFLFTPLVLSNLTFRLFKKRSTMSTNFTALLSEMLSKYDPVDLDAYRQLQAKTKENGNLENRDVRTWVEIERGAIIKGPKTTPVTTEIFLSKQV